MPVKFKIPTDCGNSPKKRFLKELCMSIAKGEVDSLDDAVVDDVVFEIPGGSSISGKEQLIKEVAVVFRKKVKEMELYKIITHGKDATVNGVIKFSNGKQFDFCFVVVFKGAAGKLLKEIRMYLGN